MRRPGRMATGIVVLLATVMVAAISFGTQSPGGGPAQLGGIGSRGKANSASDRNPVQAGDFLVGGSYQNDVSPPMRALEPLPIVGGGEEDENTTKTPRVPGAGGHGTDSAVQDPEVSAAALANPKIPTTIKNFDGIVFPGVGCSCAPPDTDGEVGLTQYVQLVNEGFQVWNKSTGASVYGPAGLQTLWSGFGGVCEFSGGGDPIVLFDQLSNRWLISEFAGGDVITDECVAVSTSPDAAGSYNRYGFHLGDEFYDYPHLGVWPDAYYMSMNVFDQNTDAYLGPQPFALDRAAMIAGTPATFVTTTSVRVASNDPFLPSDLDGSILPPAGAPNAFLSAGENSTWPLYRFHVDFATPANSTFTQAAVLSPATYTLACPTTAGCVPALGATTAANRYDAIGDRPMFRLAYRRFGDGHEALVGNMSVCVSTFAANACANGTNAAANPSATIGVRWWELSNVTSGTPAFVQQSTYQPDASHRWMGSAAMDDKGNMAIGFSKADSATRPGIWYAGRLASDTASTMAQGEALLYVGTGSQTGTNNRWGDYSDLTVDPVNDCTFWFTSEYMNTTGTFNWRTRIGSFQFDDCTASDTAPAFAAVSIYKSADATSVEAGSQVGFTVTLSNGGSDAATGLTFSDALPAATGVNWSIDAADSGWSISGSAPNQSLVYAPTSIGASVSTQAHIISSTASGTPATLTNSASFSSANGGSGTAVAMVQLLVATCGVTEGFDNVNSLFPSAGGAWDHKNLSSPTGSTDWFQGSTAVFTSHRGATDSYIGANFNSTTGASTISNWLFSPLLTLQNGAQLSFWTRVPMASTFPDRLQVLMSTNGVSTDVGATNTSTGDYSTLLLDINPTLIATGYPLGWTKYTINISGLGSPASGRIGFRYFVTNGGPSGANSNFVGIDTLSYGCSAPPAPEACTPTTNFSESFDGVTAPALPANWSASNTVGAAPLWVTSSTGTPTPIFDTTPNAALIVPPATVSDKLLNSATFNVATSSAQLSFKQRGTLGLRSSNTLGGDGGQLLISIGGGAYQDILTAGGHFIFGNYNYVMGSANAQPNAGQLGWSGTLGSATAYQATIVDLPASAAGQTVALRWRSTSDNSTASAGWRIDSISVTECVPPTSTSLSVDPASGTFNGTADLSATLATSTGSGPLTPITGKTVSFTLNGSSVGSATTDGSGVASLPGVSLAGINAGDYPTGVGASYAGGLDYAAASAMAQLSISTASTDTALESDNNPSNFGESVTFTATVTSDAGTPDGNVNFSIDGGAPIPVALDGSGEATYTTSSLAGGSHDVDAAYQGSTNYATSDASTLGQVVDKASSDTALESDNNPSTVGESVTFTATVTSDAGTPDGNVEFSIDGGAPVSVALDVSGKATLTTSSLTSGSHDIDAAYQGTADFEASDPTTLSQQVNEPVVVPDDTDTSLASNSNPSVFSQAVTFTATVTSAGGTPTGSVQFTVNGSNSGAPVALDGSGVAQLTLNSLHKGTRHVRAHYLGTAAFNSSLSNVVDQKVNKAATSGSVMSNVNPAAKGTKITFTITVSSTAPATGIPAGKVRLRINGIQVATSKKLVNGQATVTIKWTLGKGTFHITARYAGGPNYMKSISSVYDQVIH